MNIKEVGAGEFIVLECGCKGITLNGGSWLQLINSNGEVHLCLEKLKDHSSAVDKPIRALTSIEVEHDVLAQLNALITVGYSAKDLTGALKRLLNQ